MDNASVPASIGLHDDHVTLYGLSSCNATCHVSATHITNKTSANMGVLGGTPATSTGVFQYGTVNGFAVDPTNPKVMYVAMRDGLYKSTDAGATWSPANSGLTTSCTSG